jgi:hypothetical protein
VDLYLNLNDIKCLFYIIKWAIFYKQYNCLIYMKISIDFYSIFFLPDIANINFILFLMNNHINHIVIVNYIYTGIISNT